ncbi:MAG: hypothetical protein AB7E60_03870 [Sphingobium sp.]
MFSNDQLARPALAVAAEHDGRHVLRDVPNARESVLYALSLPDEGLSLFAYTWMHRDQTAGSAIAVFGPGVGDRALQKRMLHVDITADMNFGDWTVGGLHLQSDLAFQRARLSFSSEKVALDLAFEAYHPPYAYSTHPRGCPPFAADDRTEQSGRGQGVLRLPDREIRFDCAAHRDHSWGTRDWKAMQHHKWLHAQIADDVSVHFWELHAIGRTEIRGYVFKDNVMAEIAGVDFSFDYVGKMEPTAFEAVIVDELGRRTDLSAQVYAQLAITSDPTYTMNESTGRAKIDGRDAVVWLEMAWPTDYRDYIGTAGPY